MIEKAMKEEVEYMDGLPVWEEVAYRDLLPDDKVIPTKCVLNQKGRDVRARLVACESSTRLLVDQRRISLRQLCHLKSFEH